MADSFVQLPTDSTGKKVDTRTESTNSEHRQVFVIGDPSTNSGVAPVDGTKGLSVDLTSTGVNTNALKVDGSAVTQPVSGTVSIASNSSVNVAQVAGTATATNSGNVSAGTQRVVLATDQPQLSNALKVDGSATTQPVSGTVSITSNSTVNVSQVGGASTATNTGTASAGTQRVVLATDQPQLTNALKVDGSATTQPVSGTVTAAASSNLIGDVNLNTAARGGWSVSSLTSLTSTAIVSGSVGKFGGAMFLNLNSGPAYLQVFDTTGSVTLGTTTPTFVIPIPSNVTPANGGGFVLAMEVGIAMANGIKVAATTTATGATLVSTGLVGFVYYK